MILFQLTKYITCLNFVRPFQPPVLFVLHFPVLHFPVLHFQSPRAGHRYDLIQQNKMAAIAGRRYPPSVSPVGNLCHFVLLDKDESCPTAHRSNIGHTNGPAYSTGRLLNVPRDGHRTTGHSRNIMPPLHAMLQTAYGGIKINKNNCKTNCVNLANYRTETSLE